MQELSFLSVQLSGSSTTISLYILLKLYMNNVKQRRHRFSLRIFLDILSETLSCALQIPPNYVLRSLDKQPEKGK